MIKTIFWDLDGTLTLSDPGITNSVSYALRKLGEPTLPDTILKAFVGPPLLESFMKYSQLTEERARLAIVAYREYYEAGGLLENDLVPGIFEVMKKLYEEKYQMIIATSKPEKYAKIILQHFNLNSYVMDICGAEMNGRTDKAEVITYALAKHKLLADDSVIMIGDRDYDVYGARKCGIKTIGVLYGYGSEEELRRAGAISIAKNAEELYEIIKGYK